MTIRGEATIRSEKTSRSERTLESEKNRSEMKRPFEVRKDVYENSSRALRMFIEQSHDEVYGCLKGGSGNSEGKRLAISMVEEAWLSEKKEV
ncbi:hypothetical protein Tco_0505375 [Tanacetum coccineum]